MKPRFWMITNRAVNRHGLGRDRSREPEPLSFWTTDAGSVQGLQELKQWTRRTPEQFQKLLEASARAFPLVRDPAEHERQQHVTLFVHGYNNDWKDSVRRYHRICADLFSGPASLGVCVLFAWPSDGMTVGYLPDRQDARASAPDLAAVLSRLYDSMADARDAAADPQKACRAKTSLIAHSMGNYVLQKAMQLVWTRKSQPLLVSLLNQLLMVAADVDNDLFSGGETIDRSDGDAIANLTYRITILYTGRDATLGLSAGLKHFGKRRLGRTGLDDPHNVPDNVWQVDCSDLISPGAEPVHSAYFEEAKTIELMRQVLRGIDRGVIMRH